PQASRVPSLPVTSISVTGRDGKWQSVICDFQLHWQFWLLPIATADWVIAAEPSAGAIANKK
ncbi:MAG TPA: hypothetical protein VFV98_15495, partial [Vicinamibacterales bacterium]|nr:hypothetical protein [Vicinamibacterales bacterium]